MASADPDRELLHGGEITTHSALLSKSLGMPSGMPDLLHDATPILAVDLVPFCADRGAAMTTNVRMVSKSLPVIRISFVTGSPDLDIAFSQNHTPAPLIGSSSPVPHDDVLLPVHKRKAAKAIAHQLEEKNQESPAGK